MIKKIVFCFDFGSPTVYLASTQLPLIAERNSAELEYKPVLLGGIFKATGNQTPAAIPAKGAYYGVDLPRFAKKYSVPFQNNPFFPVNTLALMRGAVSYQLDGDFDGYLKTIFDSMWINPKDMNNPEIIGEVLKNGGFDPEDFMNRVSDQNVKDILIKNTEEAVQKGAFGAPTIFVGDEMFFGQDRLDFIEEALK